MNIEDFLPKYPNIVKKDDIMLNPYDKGFYESIFRKREFYDERLEETEDVPTEKGTLMKHQKIVSRFLSSHTMYDELLLVHSMGSGKTCTAIGAIEQIKNEKNNFRGAMIFAKGQGLLQNFVKELRDKCTAGQYVPEGYVDQSSGGCGVNSKNKGTLTELEVTIRTNKLIKEFYSLNTFETFAKKINKMKDSDITSTYSNFVIVIDEVHNLRIQDVTDNKISMYKEFYRFLHLIRNCKVILLSGTPMKDTPDEIASVMNLILPEKLKLPTGEKFISKYLNTHGENSFTVKKNKIKDLKKRFKGRVSFLKSIESTVKKEFVGEKNVGKLKHLIVETKNMSKFQTKYYKDAVKLDKKGTKGVHYNARQASLMVFPDGSYGQPKISGTKTIDKTRGFEKYVKTKESSKKFIEANLTGSQKKQIVTKTFELTSELKDVITGETKKENIMNIQVDSEKYDEIVKIRLKNLKKYSIKYYSVIKSILNAKDESCFVYSELISGSGSIVFAQLLKLFGFGKASGNDSTKKLRYGFLTSDISSTQLHKIINCFNQPSNVYGQIIKVMIGSKVVSEGVSFKNVQREYILTPWYNYSETDQAIARGYRLNSHKELLNNDIIPIVRISQLVAIPRNGGFSIDLSMYEISEEKDITIKGILRYMMESAFDCSLNYFRNHKTGLDGQRDCDYQKCDYVCDGIDMDDVKNGLSKDKLDNSTYQLYYANPHIVQIRKDLERYFRKHNVLNLQSILKYFDGKYNETEINNVLKIIKKDDDNMYYSDYLNIYSRDIVTKIMMEISELFSVHFRLNFTVIQNLLSEYTTFNILTALKNIIDESIVIKNKYGFSSYLRENQNIYFLVNDLSIKNDSFSNYYTRIPNIINDKTFDEILYEEQIANLPSFIKILCGITNKFTFAKLIKMIPDEVQEMFIEAAIQSKQQNIKTTKITRELVIDYFINYIHELENNVWLSNRLNDDNDDEEDNNVGNEVLRCYENNKWKDCGPEYDNVLDEKLKTEKDTLEKNPWGYYGKYNPETGVFSLVNVIEQNKKQESVKLKETKKLDQLVKKGKMTSEEKDEALKLFIAGREIYPGKNCAKGWGIPALMKIALKVLKLDYPDDFNKHESSVKMRKFIKKNRYLGIGSKNEPPTYTSNEIDNLTNDELRRAVYWSDKRSGGYIKSLCDGIKEWFKNKKWNGIDMLRPDNLGGTTGGHVKLDQKQKNKHILRTDTIIPSYNEAKFKTYLKDIEKLMKECFAIKKYVPDIDDNKWVFVFSKKKIVGFVIFDNNNDVVNLCIATHYRRQKGLPKQIIQIAVKDICPLKRTKLLMDNRDKKYTKYVKLYTEYGFNILKNDGKTTTLEFKC